MTDQDKLNYHQVLDQRSIILHSHVASKIRNQPNLLNIVKINLSKLIETNKASQIYLKKWSDLLDKPMNIILEALVEDSEEMREMRQASPFSGVLTPQERWKIYETFRT